MISINSNLSSLIIQQNLKNSTLGLNQAVERMTTGYKINHAKDNAANYSISTNLTSKLSSYHIAQDNTAMGLDMMTTAMDSLNILSDQLTRLRALAEQASNGTYGAQSLQAIQAEAGARLAECARVMSNTEYNKINLFSAPAEAAPMMLGLERSASSHDAVIPEGTKSVSAALLEGDLEAGQTYTIGDKTDLIALQDFIKLDNNTSNMTFVMTSDIDLRGDTDFEGLGYYTSYGAVCPFRGTFDGNGYTIKNLSMTKTGESAGLFLYVTRATIKNLGVENCDIESTSFAGGLIGADYSSRANTVIDNCYVTGSVKSSNSYASGFIGYIVDGTNVTITNCYNSADITGKYNVGGLIGGGDAENGYSGILTISNCYSTGSITCTGTSNSYKAGGLVGSAAIDVVITNSYATGNVSSNGYAGGLVGYCKGTITNCYATGNVNSNNYAGGLVGYCKGTITNCYATGDVSGAYNVGGLVGGISSGGAITNCYATGTVTGSGSVGGLAGDLTRGTITNSYATGDVSGTADYVGGLAGNAYFGTITNSYATGSVTGSSSVGGLAGSANRGNITNSYSTGTVSGTNTVGGLVGYAPAGTITNSYTTGTVSGTSKVGSLVGDARDATFTNLVCNSASGKPLYGYGTPTTDTNNAKISLDDMQNPTIMASYGFTDANGWDVTSGFPKLLAFSEENGWYIDDDGTPKLLAFKPASSGGGAGGAGAVGGSFAVGFQVGVGGDSNSRITLNFGFSLNLSDIDLSTSESARDSLARIDEYLKVINLKQTEFGAGVNRLESALESISVQIANLTSTRSTIRDADVAKESSQYIKMQILQQASATLLATANQTPQIALALI